MAILVGGLLAAVAIVFVATRLDGHGRAPTATSPTVATCGSPAIPPGFATASPSAAECREIAAADAAAADGDLRTALARYQSFVEHHPDSILASHARDRWATTAADWAQHLVDLESYKAAIDIYRDLIEGFRDTPVAEDASEKAGAAYVAWGALREADRSNAFHWQDAVDDYRTVLDEFGDTVSASAAREAVERLYRRAVDGLAPGRACDPQDILRALTRDGFHRKDGGALLPPAVYQCLSWEVGHGYAGLAVDDIPGFLSTYPHDPLVPKVLELRIRARVADGRDEARSGLVSDLGQPTPAGSGPRGSATVTIDNDSVGALEVLFSGPQAVSMIVPGRSSASVTLKPGAYGVLAGPKGGGFLQQSFATWALEDATRYSATLSIALFD